jgi:hypothetical protein
MYGLKTIAAVGICGWGEKGKERWRQLSWGAVAVGDCLGDTIRGACNHEFAVRFFGIFFGQTIDVS